MPFIKQINKDFFIKDNRIFVSEELFKKNQSKSKKITGTRFCSILGTNSYTSPVKVWTNLVSIFKEDMDPTLSQVGNVVESKVKDYVEKITNIRFKTYNPFKEKWDVFKEDDTFGGIPDGEPIDSKGNFTYDKGNPMLEIKTSSIDSFVYKFINNTLRMQKDNSGYPMIKKEGGKKQEWFDKNGKIIIPQQYSMQLSLYMYLRNVEKGMFAIAFLKKEDYKYPEMFNASEADINLIEIYLDKNNFTPLINFGREWYQTHIMKNPYSPELTQSDKLWLSKELGIII